MIPYFEMEYSIQEVMHGELELGVIMVEDKRFEGKFLSINVSPVMFGGEFKVDQEKSMLHINSKFLAAQ